MFNIENIPLTPVCHCDNPFIELAYLNRIHDQEAKKPKIEAKNLSAIRVSDEKPVPKYNNYSEGNFTVEAI